MTTPDPVDELLGELKPPTPPAADAKAEQAFRNYAAEAKAGAAPLWRIWGRWLEPALVALFVCVFVIWALMRVFGG